MALWKAFHNGTMARWKARWKGRKREKRGKNIEALRLGGIGAERELEGLEVVAI